MILNAISNVEARMIALTLIEKKVAAPLRQSLWDDKESEERVARILAIAMGYAIHRQLLPLKSIAAPLAPGTRRWLARPFQHIIDEPLKTLPGGGNLSFALPLSPSKTTKT